jgi:hypothetical protein
VAVHSIRTNHMRSHHPVRAAANAVNPACAQHAPVLDAINNSVGECSQQEVRWLVDALLSMVPVQTKWVVAATVALVFLYYRNAECAWCIVGSIVCSFLGKVRADRSALRPSARGTSLQYRTCGLAPIAM